MTNMAELLTAETQKLISRLEEALNDRAGIVERHASEINAFVV